MTTPTVSRPIPSELVVAFGPGTHNELVLRDSRTAWCLRSEPERRFESAAAYYGKRLQPYLDELDIPESARALLAALATGQSPRAIRKAGIGRH